jgi:hypothetical protein
MPDRTSMPFSTLLSANLDITDKGSSADAAFINKSMAKNPAENLKSIMVEPFGERS